MARPFLTARWENLAIISYAVDDALLTPHIPAGLELDRREGQAFVSLVAFDFRETRVFGRRWPGCVNFPEINLRFYLRDPATGRRGVCFIREFVRPRPVVWIARWVYNEPYQIARIVSRSETSNGTVRLMHAWRHAGRDHALGLVGRAGPSVPSPDSAEHWFKEHEWGFGRDRRGAGITYRVEHPVWGTYPVESLDLKIDYAALYGPRWGALNEREPDSVVFAAGSEVRVYPRCLPWTEYASRP